MDIETIGQYEVVLEAYPGLSGEEWVSYLTIYRGHAAAYKSERVLERQMVVSETPLRSREQAITLARFQAARKIARGKF